MADNKKKNVSETFGKYTGSASKGKGKGTAEPKNITSDMWTPISGSYTDAFTDKSQKKAPEKKSAQTKSTKSARAEPEKDSFISDGRASEKKEARAKKKTASKKKKSRTPKGKPISELTQEKLSKNNDVRKQQKLSKSERAYDERIKEGKSPGEISKERAETKRKKRTQKNQ